MSACVNSNEEEPKKPHFHLFDTNGECIDCSFSIADIDCCLYDLNYDGSSYIVKGIKNGEYKDCFIPSTYNGLPVEAIMDYALDGSQLVENIVVQNGIKTIGNYAFRGCTNLKTLTISKDVTSIGKGLYDGNLNIIGLNVPTIAFNNQYIKSPIEKLIINGGDSFYLSGLTSLSYIEISGDLKKVDISNMPNLIDIVINEGIEIIEQIAKCEKLEKIVLPSSVIEIKDKAFEGCTNLKEINLPESITEIGDYAFLSCESLKNVNLPSKLKTISRGMFKDCKNLISIKIPDGVNKINIDAFGRCTNLKEVELSNNIKDIDLYAFYDCMNLININLNNVENFGFQSFYNCVGLNNLKLEKAKVIEPFAFNECKFIEVLIGDELEEISITSFFGSDIKKAVIPSQAFLAVKNHKLETVQMTSGTTMIGNETFDMGKYQYDDFLEEYNWDEVFEKFRNISIYYYSETTSEYQKEEYMLSDVSFPNTLIEVGGFSSCTKLKEIKLPSSVTKLHDGAFKYSSINNIDLKNINNIGSYAFLAALI